MGETDRESARTDFAGTDLAGTEEASTAQAGTHRRALVAGIVLGSLAVGGILGGTGWGLAVATAADGLRIEYGVQPVTCEGAEVTAEAVDTHDEYATRFMPRVAVEAGMRCQLSLQLVNDGWADVSVESVALPTMGEQMAWNLEPQFVNPNGMQRLDDAETPADSAAVFHLDGVTAWAGSITPLTAVIEWTSSDAFALCSSFVPPSPSVTVDVLGAERVVASDPLDGVRWARGTTAQRG